MRKPDNFENAMDLLRRQHYDEVAEFVEQVVKEHKMFVSRAGEHMTVIPQDEQ